jgi:hypothetical protein
MTAQLFIGDGSGLTNLNSSMPAPGSITSDKLAVGAVTAANLGAGSVGSSALAFNAVTTEKLATGAVTSVSLADNSVGSSHIIDGAISAADLAPGSVGTNKAIMSEWNAWGNSRYMPAAGSPDLVLGEPGRIVGGQGVSLMNISMYAYGASQLGLNGGSQMIGVWAEGASQVGENWGTQTISESAFGALQRGYNDNVQTIGVFSIGASQVGANCGPQIIGAESFGASQNGYNVGTQTIGSNAYGAEQRGFVDYNASATNTGVGSIQLLNLTASQTALITGHASIGLGASTVTNDQAIVAGDGLTSHGNGTVTARGFYGDGSGLTNLNLSTVASESITSDKLAIGAVTAEKLAVGSVGTNNAVQSEWNAWARAQVPAQTQQVYVATAGTATTATTVTGAQSNTIASALQPANTNGWTVSAHDAWITAPTATNIGLAVVAPYTNGATLGATALQSIPANETLAVVASRGGFAGTETISPLNISIGGDLSGAGRRVFGTGLNVMDINATASGANQSGYNSGMMNIGADAYGASQSGRNTGMQTIGANANGASQIGQNFLGTQAIEDWASGASQRGANYGFGGFGIMIIGDYAFGASQSGENRGTMTIGEDAGGASQSGYNSGRMSIGVLAYGASQSGRVGSSAYAANNAVGAMQLFDLTVGQDAQTTVGGSASILLGAGVASNKNAIVAGDGQVSHGDGSITAGGGFYGNLTGNATTATTVTGAQSNLIASALQPASTNGWTISSHSNLLTINGNGSALSGIVKTSDTNDWTVSAHDAWITAAQVPAQTQQIYVATAGTAGAVTGVQSQLLTSALQPASITNLVPYTGAASSVNLGTNSMTAKLFIGDGSGLTNLSSSMPAPGSITSDKLAVGAVTAANLGAGSVGSSALAFNAVTTEKLADGAVTGGKIASGVINSEHLAEGSVTVAKLAISSNLNMNGNRVTNLALPANDGDALTKAYLRAVLSAIPPQGDLSMGSFTNGAPASFPLSF